MKQLSNEYVGTEVSNATMRTEDLIPTFLSFLQAMAEECEIHKEVDAIQDDVDNFIMMEHNGYGECYKGKDQEQAAWILNEDIWNLMNSIAPDYTYFGAHEGDGASYGFWTDEESLQDALMANMDALNPQPELDEIRGCCEYVINLLDVHNR